MNDQAATQLQETGRVSVATMTLAEVNEIVTTLGIDPTTAKIDVGGWLYISGGPYISPLLSRQENV